jgi:CelD/BcsL family acetyltransferase involved in cellulose biosynthesis
MHDPFEVVLRRLARRGDASIPKAPRVPPPLELKEGERVRVRTIAEIVATLDERERCDGLAWMDLMAPFCGRTFTVVRRVNRFFDERTRRMLRCRNAVLLEGVHCVPTSDAPYDYAGCERMCLLFWHEAWLERAAEEEAVALPLEVQEITTAEQLPAIEADWRALVELSPGARLFHTWEWLAAQLSLCWEGRLAVLLVRRGARLVGAAPLVLDREGENGCAGSLSVPESRLDLLCAEPAGGVLDAVLAHLGRSRRSWSLTLPRCSFASETLAALRTSAPHAGAGTYLCEIAPSRVVRSAGGWDSYLASRDSHVRREWKRKQNKLERAGAVEFRTPITGSDVARAMADVLAIERTSWKEAEGTSLANELHSTELYSALAEGYATLGWLRLHVLYLDGKPIAHLFGVRFRNELYALKTSYDAAYAALSPGLLVVLHALRHALAEGCSAIDLLGSDSRWKREVATDSPAAVSVCVFSANQLSCQACRLVRGELKSWLAPRAPSLLTLMRRSGLTRLLGTPARPHPSGR